LACDQSRSPPGRSIRLTSSSVNGAYLARHFQKLSASLSSDSAFNQALANVTKRTTGSARREILIDMSFAGEARRGSKNLINADRLIRSGILQFPPRYSTVTVFSSREITGSRMPRDRLFRGKEC